ncbi:MAG: virulence RhuM family protein [Desulfobacula sp.]|nr:virulence RhuM family protein [Desulfobacula sp.]
MRYLYKTRPFGLHNRKWQNYLFGVQRPAITKHLKNIFKEGELEESLVCRNFRHTTQHGAIEGKIQEKDVKYYNLDVIISVGYRVKSIQGTKFRQWATARLREYIVKGFTENIKDVKFVVLQK